MRPPSRRSRRGAVALLAASLAASLSGGCSASGLSPDSTGKDAGPDLAGPPPCPAAAFALRLNLIHDETIAWLGALARRPDGRFLVAGGTSYAEPEAGIDFRFWVAAVDGEGRVPWSGREDWSPESLPRLRQSARAILPLDDGGFVVAGTLQDGLHLGRRDAAGKLVSSATAAQPNTPIEVYGFDVAPDGDYFAAGSTGDVLSAMEVAWARRLDAKAGTRWEVPLPFGTDSRARAGRALAGGRFAVAGVSGLRSGSPRRAFAAVVDATGRVVWQRLYDFDTVSGFTAILEADGGDLLLAGDAIPDGAQVPDGILVRVDGAGAPRWQARYGGPARDTLSGLARLGPDFPGGGGFILTGETESIGHGQPDLWLVRTDERGQLQWQRAHGDRYWDAGYAVLPLTTKDDGAAGFLVAGFTSAPDQSERGDAWLVRTDELGRLTCDDGGSCATDAVRRCQDGQPCDTEMCTPARNCLYEHRAVPCMVDGGM